MAYSTEKLKSNDNNTSPCFKPFLIGNMTNICLPGHCYRFHSDTLLLALTIHGDTKLNERIIQDLPPDSMVYDLHLVQTRDLCLFSFQ